MGTSNGLPTTHWGHELPRESSKTGDKSFLFHIPGLVKFPGRFIEKLPEGRVRENLGRSCPQCAQ